MTLVLVVGLVGSWALVVAVDRQQKVHAAAAMDLRVQVIHSAVAAEVRRYVETSADLAAAIGAQSDLSASDFTAMTSNLDRLRLSGVSGVSLAVPATDDEIPRVQHLWRARGTTQLSLAPAGTADEHLFMVFNRPYGTAPRTGVDPSAATEPAQAMAASHSSGQVRASHTHVLLKDQGLPDRAAAPVLRPAAPVIGGLGTPQEGKLQGWLLMGVRGQDFISQTIEAARRDGWPTVGYPSCSSRCAAWGRAANQGPSVNKWLASLTTPCCRPFPRQVYGDFQAPLTCTVAERSPHDRERHERRTPPFPHRR